MVPGCAIGKSNDCRQSRAICRTGAGSTAVSSTMAGPTLVRFHNRKMSKFCVRVGFDEINSIKHASKSTQHKNVIFFYYFYPFADITVEGHAARTPF